MSLMTKPTTWLSNRSDKNRALQSQKMVRGWKFWKLKVEELYYPCIENKGADQLRTCEMLVFSRHGSNVKIAILLVIFMCAYVKLVLCK